MPISVKYLLKSKKYGECFVETGSHRGLTIDKALKAGFDKIKSVEFDAALYKYCSEKYKKNTRVQIYEGSSVNNLWNMIKYIDERIVFWLDAHYSGDGSSMDDLICPVLEELSIIECHHLNNHIILIDDVRLFKVTGNDIKRFTGEFEVLLDDVIFKLRDINLKYNIFFINGFVANDVMVAVPSDISKIIFDL